MISDMISDLARRLWNTVGIYKARHPLIVGMWVVGGRFFDKRAPTPEERFLMRLNFDGKTVYDVGANVGQMTLFFARAAGAAGFVVAFEPHPYSYKGLLRSVRVNRLRHVRLVNKGAGDAPTTLVLYQPSRHLSGATLNGERAARLNEGRLLQYTVEIDTIDNMVESLNLPLPDFVKIDVEGFEEHVLRGAIRTLEHNGPDFFIEIHRLADGTPTTAGVIGILRAYNYTFYHVESGGHIDAHNCSNIRGGHIFAVCQQGRLTKKQEEGQF